MRTEPIDLPKDDEQAVTPEKGTTEKKKKKKRTKKAKVVIEKVVVNPIDVKLDKLEKQEAAAPVEKKESKKSKILFNEDLQRLKIPTSSGVIGLEELLRAHHIPFTPAEIVTERRETERLQSTVEGMPTSEKLPGPNESGFLPASRGRKDAMDED